MHNKNKEYIKKSIPSSFAALCTHDTPLSCVAFSRFANSKAATLTFLTNTLK